MNVKKIKTCIIMVILMLSLVSISNFVFAKTTLELNSFGNAAKTGDEIQITIKIKDVSSIGVGINAYLGTVTFDQSLFELSSITGKNGWADPTYNSETLSQGSTKITSTRNSFLSSDGELFVVTLKAKKDIDKNSTLGLKDFTVAVKNADNTITESSIEATSLSIISSNNGNNNSTNNNNDKSSVNSNASNVTTNTNKSVPTKLPQTGIKSSTIVITSTCLIGISLFYAALKYKNISVR